MPCRLAQGPCNCINILSFLLCVCGAGAREDYAVRCIPGGHDEWHWSGQACIGGEWPMLC